MINKVLDSFGQSRVDLSYASTSVLFVDKGVTQSRMKHLNIWGGVTLQRHFFVQLKEHFLKSKRAFLCLLHNLWGHMPPVPMVPYVSGDTSMIKPVYRIIILFGPAAFSELSGYRFRLQSIMCCLLRRKTSPPFRQYDRVAVSEPASLLNILIGAP